MKQLSLPDFLRRFPDNQDACLDFVFQKRFGTLTACSKCGVEQPKFYRVKGRPAYACTRCRLHIYPLAGTVMEGSGSQLFRWFYALYLFSTSKSGVSARELSRALGVTYKCGWNIGRRIRQSMIETHPPQLSGIVHVDETLFGGYRPGKRGWAAENKVCLLGMVEEEGRARVFPIPDRKGETILPLIKCHIAPGSVINTDEFRVYRKLEEIGYQHRTVIHSRYQWRVGDTHTNCVEGFWSNLKKSVFSTHTYVSPGHLQEYLAEACFRWSHRQGKVMFDEMMERLLLLG